MHIQVLSTSADADWLALRTELWPDGTADEHRGEMADFLAAPERYGQFIARGASGEPLGFVEIAVRHDYVNGTDGPPPVGFLEGLYVRPPVRRLGVARRLVDAAAAWAIARGCRELASDTPLDNRLSQAVHARLGFEETERVVYFRRTLT